MKWKKYFFEKVGSTNDVAKTYPIGSVIVARTQESGRGRYGRVWKSVDGNLYLSVVLPDYQEKSPLLSFLVGVALAQAFASFNVRLKWPNDVLLNKQKLAGILLENQGDKIIAGIGVNVADCPNLDDMPYQAASLCHQISADEACDSILHHLGELLEIFETQGFEPIRQKWIHFAEGLHQEITVKLPHETYSGRFTQITPLGAIDLELQDKTHRLITAGDVFFTE